MLKTTLIHPEILAALGQAGHSSKVLISDGNYPHWTKSGPNAQVVFLNLAPGLVNVTDVLKPIADAIPIEAAEVMDPAGALPEDPQIWAEFRQIFAAGKVPVELTKLGRFEFYDAALSPDVCLTIATGEQRIYANILLTIGVVPPD